MSEFDITTDEETPVQRAAFGETLRNARVADEAGRRLHPVIESALKQPGMVTTAAAREMITSMQRKRREAEERTQHRELTAYLALGAALAMLAGAVPFAPTVVAGIALTAAVFVAGMLVGLTLRSKL